MKIISIQMHYDYHSQSIYTTVVRMPDEAKYNDEPIERNFICKTGDFTKAYANMASRLTGIPFVKIIDWGGINDEADQG